MISEYIVRLLDTEIDKASYCLVIILSYSKRELIHNRALLENRTLDRQGIYLYVMEICGVS